jgi:hypothetical protein
MEMVLPRNHVEIEQEEMMYLDGGFYVSNSQLKGVLVAVGMNPMGAVSAAVLASGIRKAGTAIGARIGLIGGPKGALFGSILGFAVSGVAAGTIAHALIQGKGIGVDLNYTSWGMPYSVSINVR